MHEVAVEAMKHNSQDAALIHFNWLNKVLFDENCLTRHTATSLSNSWYCQSFQDTRLGGSWFELDHVRLLLLWKTIKWRLDWTNETHWVASVSRDLQTRSCTQTNVPNNRQTRTQNNWQQCYTHPTADREHPLTQQPHHQYRSYMKQWWPLHRIHCCRHDSVPDQLDSTRTRIESNGCHLMSHIQVPEPLLLSLSLLMTMALLFLCHQVCHILVQFPGDATNIYIW